MTETDLVLRDEVRKALQGLMSQYGQRLRHTCNYYCHEGTHTDLCGLLYNGPPQALAGRVQAFLQQTEHPRLLVHTLVRAPEADVYWADSPGFVAWRFTYSIP